MKRTTLTKEELAKASAHRYEQSFCWLLTSERTMLEMGLRQLMKDWNSHDQPASWEIAQRLLSALTGGAS